MFGNKLSLPLALAKTVLCGREHLFCGAFIGISMFRGCAAARRGAWMIHQIVQQPPKFSSLNSLLTICFNIQLVHVSQIPKAALQLHPEKMFPM